MDDSPPPRDRPQLPGRPPKTPHREAPAKPPAAEISGPKGPEPTRYGDWEFGGRCTDF